LYNNNPHLKLTAKTKFGMEEAQAMLFLIETSDAFYPTSPYKIGYLLREVLIDQGADTLIIPKPYYESVAQQVSEIQDRCTRELNEYTTAYSHYARITSSITLLTILFSFVKALAVYAFFITGVLLIATYVLYPSLYWWSYEPPPHSILAVFIASILAPPLISVLESLVPYGLRRRARESIEPAEAALYRRLAREFRAAAVDLIRTTHERRLDPILYSDQAPTLVEIESTHVLPSGTFDRIKEFLKLHVTSTVGIAGRRGAGKSTLLRWLTDDLEPDWVSVYLPAPTNYDAADFARTIFRTTVNSVIKSSQAATIPLRYKILNALTRANSSEDIDKLSREILDLIGMSRTDQWNTAVGLSGKGAAIQRQRQITLTEREPTHPELTAAFAAYLETYRRLGGKRIIIAIDELDKIAETDDAIGVINNLKELFHLPNTHFVVSVSEDALARFAMRGVPFRDVFDSAFDEIVQLQPPSPEEAWKLLAYRAGGFPISIALFCYAWSGGLPRDLIRTARACVDIRRQLGHPATIAELAAPVIRQDVKAAVDAALNASLEIDSDQGVEFLLELRRKVDTELIPLDTLLRDAQPDIDLTARINDPHAVDFRRLILYIELGVVVSEFFANNIDTMITSQFNETLNIVEMLARARSALAMYPSEAERFLSEAIEAKGPKGR
jgi:hypothetical protein